MDSRFIDFDAERAERTKEPLILRAYGQEFELPGTMSAALFLDVVRMGEEKGSDAQVSAKDSIGLLRRVLPDEVLDSLTARADFDVNDLIELAKMVMQAYHEQSGEAPAPNRATRRRAK